MRLVPDWRECWKWNSMHGMGAAMILIGSWNALPDKWQDVFPQHIVLSLASVALLLGIAGRLRDQTSDKPKPPVTVPEPKQ